MTRAAIDGAGSAPPDGRKKWKGTHLRVDLEPISDRGIEKPNGPFPGPRPLPPAAGSTPITHGTSRDFSPPSRARRGACSDLLRIGASRGVPGATRDGLFGLVVVRRLQPRLLFLQEALRHGIPALMQNPTRKDGLVVTSLQAGSLESPRMLCSRVHQAAQNKLRELV